MRQIASIGVAIAALTITALPVHADDQSISFAVGAIGGTSLPVRGDVPQAQITPRPYGALDRAAPLLQGTEAYSGYAQSGGYVQKNCGYTGGPKGPGWTCQ
jgi:hypothetical protein